MRAYQMWDEAKKYFAASPGSKRHPGVENAREGTTIQITKKAEAADSLNIYLLVVMDAQLKIEDGRSSQRLINLLPQTAHSATICGQTGCGKTVFVLDLLEGPIRGSFNTSWSCAQPYGMIRTISSVPRSVRTPRSTLLNPPSDSTTTCERFTMYLWANRCCISSMTVQLRRR